jgi:hypothetical protein
MIIEATTALVLALLTWGRWHWWLALLGLLLVVVIWVSTAYVQVPCHKALDDRLDATVVNRLVRTNWIRTLAWTARGLLAILICHAI